MKQSLYLETSVVGAYLDNGEPFRRDLTIRWWEHELAEYRAFSSILVQRELEQVSEPHRTSYLKLIAPLETLELAEEVSLYRSALAETCAKAYIKSGSRGSK